MDGAVKDALTADWCDVLSEFTLAEVRDGIRALFAASNGNLRSLNEHQVKDRIEINQRRLVESLPRKADLEPGRDFSPEAVARRRAVSAELLGASRSLATLRGQSEAQTQSNINAAKDEAGL